MNFLPSPRTNWSVLLVLTLLCNSSGRAGADADERETSSDHRRDSHVVVGAGHLSLRFTSGIRSIFEDSQGRFWFGSHQEGVCLFDGRTFIYYTVADGLIGNQIRSIQEDAAGVVWFGTDRGITSFDGKTFETPFEQNEPNWAIAVDPTWSKAAGDLWFHGDSGTSAAHHKGQGVYRYDGYRLDFLPLPLPSDVAVTSDYRVTSIARGRRDTVWIATYPAVFGYDGRAFTIINDETPGRGIASEPFHVRSVFEDSRGVLWIGHNGLGVLRYDGQSLTNFTEQHGLSLAEKGADGSLARVFSIAEDAIGHLWFGTSDNGAWRFDGESLTNFTRLDGLTSPMVWTIYRDRRDQLWFGLADGSVCRFNGQTFERVF